MENVYEYQFYKIWHCDERGFSDILVILLDVSPNIENHVHLATLLTQWIFFRFQFNSKVFDFQGIVSSSLLSVNFQLKE